MIKFRFCGTRSLLKSGALLKKITKFQNSKVLGISKCLGRGLSKLESLKPVVPKFYCTLGVPQYLPLCPLTQAVQQEVSSGQVKLHLYL